MVREKAFAYKENIKPVKADNQKVAPPKKKATVNATSRFQNINDQHLKNITVYANGTPRVNFRFLLKSPRSQVLDYILDDVAVKISAKTGYAIRTLFTTSGKKIIEAKDIIDGDSYVAAGSEKFKNAAYGMGSAASVERPGRVKSRPLKPLKPAVKPQKEHKEIQGLKKPTKVQRPEALPPIQVQPIQSKGEEPEVDIVADAKDIKTDVPIDQQEIKHVVDEEDEIIGALVSDAVEKAKSDVDNNDVGTVKPVERVSSVVMDNPDERGNEAVDSHMVDEVKPVEREHSDVTNRTDVDEVMPEERSNNIVSDSQVLEEDIKLVEFVTTSDQMNPDANIEDVTNQAAEEASGDEEIEELGNESFGLLKSDGVTPAETPRQEEPSDELESVADNESVANDPLSHVESDIPVTIISDPGEHQAITDAVNFLNKVEPEPKAELVAEPESAQKNEGDSKEDPSAAANDIKEEESESFQEDVASSKDIERVVTPIEIDSLEVNQPKEKVPDEEIPKHESKESHEAENLEVVEPSEVTQPSPIEATNPKEGSDISKNQTPVTPQAQGISDHFTTEKAKDAAPSGDV